MREHTQALADTSWMDDAVDEFPTDEWDTVQSLNRSES
jgi:hypothetical protein